jgi:uncharacterized protein YuzE
MKIKYSRDADVLVNQLRERKPADSRDISGGIIVHLTAKGQPLEIEILDASKVVRKKDVEVALDAISPYRGPEWQLDRTGLECLQRQAVKALRDRLGPVGALRFLALISREPFDYQAWRGEYFSRYNVGELLDEVRKHHAGKVP